jgi:hypothetical protein
MKRSILFSQICRLKQLLILLVWSLLIAPIAMAQTEQSQKPVPDERGRKPVIETVFTYQGQLKEGILPASGTYDFRFTLYSAQTGSEEISSVTLEAVSVSDGLFTVRLNFGNAIPVSRESWLEVGVRHSYSSDLHTVLSPRQRLTPTPYAILAKAETWSLIGVPVGFPDRRDPDSSVGSDRTPGDIQERTVAKEKAVADDKAAGEKNTATAAESSGWVAEQGVVRLSASKDKVGIGTNAPKASLDVAGDLHVSGPVKSGNSITVDGSNHTITATTVTGQPFSKQIRIGYQDTVNPGPFSDIQVGIGTLTPTHTLHIFGTTRFSSNSSSGVATLDNNPNVYLRAGANGGARILGQQGNTPARPAIGFFSTNGVDDGGGGNGIFRPLANTMAFATVSAERMRITSGGNVGIGTNNPLAMLAVGNNTFQVNNAGNLIRINNVPYSWPVAQGAAGTVLINNGAGTLNWAAPGGGVSGSCNTVGPNGSGTNFVTKWSSTSALMCSQIFDNGTNVGIGTTAPTARTEILHSNLNAGAFALRLTNQGSGASSFTETGLAFNTSVGNNPNYYAARIYARYDGTGVSDGRLTMQTRDGFGNLVDALNVKNGSVGIGTISPTNTLHVMGTVRVDTLAAAGGNPLCINANVLSACPPSDGRLKTNVIQLTNVVTQLAKVRGVSFNWNEASRPLVSSTGRREIGVIAQEVEAVFPEVVTSWGDNYKAVDYGKLSAVLIEAVKELKAENDSLKQRIEALEKAVVKK